MRILPCWSLTLLRFNYAYELVGVSIVKNCGLFKELKNTLSQLMLMALLKYTYFKNTSLSQLLQLTYMYIREDWIPTSILWSPPFFHPQLLLQQNFLKNAVLSDICSDRLPYSNNSWMHIQYIRTCTVSCAFINRELLIWS